MTERRYFVGVAAGDHVQKGVEGGFCMFAHGKHSAIKRLNAGDLFAYYAPMSGMQQGKPIRAFVAVGRIGNAPPYEAEMGGSSGWRRDADYLPAHAADIYPLLEHLSFIADRAHWGMAFRKSLFAVTRADFELIAAAMGAKIDPDQMETSR